MDPLEVNSVLIDRPMEVWLKPNRRIQALGLAPAVLLGLLSAAVVLLLESPLARTVAGTLAVGAVVLGIAVLAQWRRPRIAFHQGQVLFYLRTGQPIAVPVGVVEAFFVGQGPAHLPVGAEANFNSLNLVARLSRKAPEWAEQEVKPALAKWHDGYVSIRGTWCEPLDEQLLRRINRRLREVSQTAAAKDSGGAGKAG